MGITSIAFENPALHHLMMRLYLNDYQPFAQTSVMFFLLPK